MVLIGQSTGYCKKERIIILVIKAKKKEKYNEVSIGTWTTRQGRHIFVRTRLNQGGRILSVGRQDQYHLSTLHKSRSIIEGMIGIGLFDGPPKVVHQVHGQGFDQTKTTRRAGTTRRPTPTTSLFFRHIDGYILKGNREFLQGLRVS